MTWELKINKVENGYVLEWEEENEENVKLKKQQVIEEPDTEDGELEAMKMLLLEVKEHFGIYSNKYDKKKLNIEIIDGEND